MKDRIERLKKYARENKEEIIVGSICGGYTLACFLVGAGIEKRHVNRGWRIDHGTMKGFEDGTQALDIYFKNGKIRRMVPAASE